MRIWLAVACVWVVLLAGCSGASNGGGGTPAPSAPTANAGGPYTGSAGTAVNFSAAGSSDPQGQTLTYAWNFGDSTSGTGASPAHTYAAAGTYTVSLTVTDTSGLSGTATAKTTVGAAPLTYAPLTGTVMSGAVPVVGAHVYLFAAGAAGYGGNGIVASANNASRPLLSSAQTGTVDALGAYVTTGANGQFSLTGDYSCTSGQQLYLYASGGSTGGGTNTEIGLMAVLGNCPAASATAVYAVVNDISTVAAAYALAGFATDSTHIGSSGTALAQVGIANAFANVANLETLATGVALTTTPAGNGTVPQKEINTLGNFLSGCIDSTGRTSNGCLSLFLLTPSGGTTGVTASDTASAAINIAHNPGVNVVQVYITAAGVSSYSPALAAAPNDWTISALYSGSGIAGPVGLAVDAAGNVWIANQGVTSGATGSVTELNANGIPLSGSSGFTSSSMVNPNVIAIDQAGNAWVGSNACCWNVEILANGTFAPPLTGYTLLGSRSGAAVDGKGNAWFSGGFQLAEYSSAGSSITGTLPYVNHAMSSSPDLPSLAIDGSGTAWVAGTIGSVVAVSSNGTFLSGNSGYPVAGCLYESIAIDNTGNVWVGCEFGGSIAKLSNTGAVLSGTNGYGYGVLNSPQSIAIDGNGTAWVTSWTQVFHFSASGAMLTGTNGFLTGSVFTDNTGLAIDGSGDVWIVVNGAGAPSGQIAQMIGAGIPVITPLAAALPVVPTTDGSSRLGTRP